MFLRLLISTGPFPKKQTPINRRKTMRNILIVMALGFAVLFSLGCDSQPNTVTQTIHDTTTIKIDTTITRIDTIIKIIDTAGIKTSSWIIEGKFSDLPTGNFVRYDLKILKAYIVQDPRISTDCNIRTYISSSSDTTASWTPLYDPNIVNGAIYWTFAEISDPSWRFKIVGISAK